MVVDSTGRRNTLIAKGLTSEEAGIAVGASQAAGSRWFRDRGGMPSIDLAPPSGRYLSFLEREEIGMLKAQGAGVRQIARRLGRGPSTISRELRRNAATRGGKLEYRASVAQWKAELLAQRPKTAKLVANERLREYVQDSLSGLICTPAGEVVAGSTVPEWKGRNKPHRQDRRWATSWSPEQIANRLKVDFPEADSTRRRHRNRHHRLLGVTAQPFAKYSIVDTTVDSPIWHDDADINSPPGDGLGPHLDHSRPHAACPGFEVRIAKDLVDSRAVLDPSGTAARGDVPTTARGVLVVLHAERNIIVATRKSGQKSGVHGPKVDEAVENDEVHRYELLAFNIDESYASHGGRTQKLKALCFGQLL